MTCKVCTRKQPFDQMPMVCTHSPCHVCGWPHHDGDCVEINSQKAAPPKDVAALLEEAAEMVPMERGETRAGEIRYSAFSDRLRAAAASLRAECAEYGKMMREPDLTTPDWWPEKKP